MKNRKLLGAIIDALGERISLWGVRVEPSMTEVIQTMHFVLRRKYSRVEHFVLMMEY